jgi:hypothetical protein
MLVFFIHGVATRDVRCADTLKALIKNEFVKRGKPLPHFHLSFWGNIVKDISKIWNQIHQDLQIVQQKSPEVNIDDIFRYKNFREGFLSDFVGDVLTYLNPERGEAIRKVIAQDLHDFITNHPEETELHIVAHSLGSVILWDVLFSERFSSKLTPKDPALYIRAMIEGFRKTENIKEIKLQSITTMGSPILFFNTMFGVTSEQIKEITKNYQHNPLRWTNIVQSSDIIAYPLKSSINFDVATNFSLKDEYICTDVNLAEKAARTIGQFDVAMALAVNDAHSWYWSCHKTASLIVNNVRNTSIVRQSS